MLSIVSAKQPKPITYREPRPTAWLWILAVAILVAAAGIVFVMRQQPHDPDMAPRIKLIIAAAAVCSGICVISALAWSQLKR